MSDLGGLGGERGNSHLPLPSCKKGQVPKRKNHFFTIFGYTEDTIGGLLTYFNKHATKYAFQEEICPTSGTEHLQGMVMFPKETRDTQFYQEGKGRFFALKLEDGAYQTKDASRKPGGGRWTKGLPKPLKIIQVLRPWQQEIVDLVLTEPDDSDDALIHWYWEETGGVGKSALVKYLVVKHNALFCDGGKKADLINLVFNNNMDDCKCIIWDLPRATKGNISYSTLESIKNGLICNTKYETGNKVFNPPHVVVFANFPPSDESELSERRWRITHL